LRRPGPLGEDDIPPGQAAFALDLRTSLRNGFGRTFWVFFVLAVISGTACWFLKGRAAVIDSLSDDFQLMVSILPRIAAAVAVAGLFQVLIPRTIIARALGEKSGIKGIAVATAAGALTPGGPMTSFPLVTALHHAGSGRTPLVAYVTSWSVLGFQRVLTWEIPLLGADFALIRALASLPLPFVAAAMSRLVRATPPAGKQDPQI
jgi:uncharacterized membrane protein YraQ (UPF0718 family)